MRIQDKVVVITGGASGLGLATARYLANEKAARIAIFDLDVEAGEKAVAEIGPKCAMFVHTDVSSEGSVQAAVAAVMEKFGAIHVCINGAATMSGVRILGKGAKATPLHEFAQSTAINLNGVFNVMSRCAEQMAKNELEAGEERGVIINVSAGAAFEGQVGQCAFSATKAAIIGMNMPSARELGAIGVRVNAIAPGMFLTAAVAELGDKALSSLKAQMEAPKRLGDMREFAHCCAFIIENAYVNAETIRLDAASRMRAR